MRTENDKTARSQRHCTVICTFTCPNSWLPIHSQPDSFGQLVTLSSPIMYICAIFALLCVLVMPASSFVGTSCTKTGTLLGRRGLSTADVPQLGTPSRCVTLRPSLSNASDSSRLVSRGSLPPPRPEKKVPSDLTADAKPQHHQANDAKSVPAELKSPMRPDPPSGPNFNDPYREMPRLHEIPGPIMFARLDRLKNPSKYVKFRVVPGGNGAIRKGKEKALRCYENPSHADSAAVVRVKKVGRESQLGSSMSQEIGTASPSW